MIMGIWFYHTDYKIGGKIEMANRQYIGARYVPKYFENPDGSTNWVQGINYEPLTIVTYLGTSYTSKIPVPANIGSPNLNNDYWVATGSGSADIEQIKSQIQVINTEISDLKNDMTNVVPKEDQYYILLTDSYGKFPCTDGTLLADRLFQNMGIDSNHYSVYSQTGGGMSTFYLPTNNVWQLKQVTESLTAEQINNTVKIIIEGGANDMIDDTPPETIIPQIKAFMEYAKEHYPNAEVMLGCFSNRMLAGDMIHRRKTIDAYKTIGEYGGKYIENSEWIMMDYSLYQADDIHPTPTACDQLAMEWIPFILNGKGTVYRETVNPFISNDNNITIDYQYCKLCQLNESIFFKCTTTTGIILDCSFTQEATVGTGAISSNGITLSNFYGMNGIGESLKIPLVGYFADSTGLIFQNGSVNFNIAEPGRVPDEGIRCRLLMYGNNEQSAKFYFINQGAGIIC